MATNIFKFRAWDHFNAHMRYSTDNLALFFINMEELKKAGNGIVYMQFTGREDAEINGTEVWEGDIIQNCDTKELEVVYWNETECAWFCRYVKDSEHIVSLADSLGNLNKVVGNIYENPPLA